MHKDHPVYFALISRLEMLRDLYRRQPCEQNRYRLVRQEQLMAQWMPSSDRPS
jgi:hypothetical protein